MLDIDHFKAVNDAFGHIVGDQILADLGTLVRASVRSMDISCRYGGEEFAVLLPGAPVQDALVVAERIRGAVANHQFRSLKEGSRLTVSVGVAGVPDDAVDRNGLIKAADDALYYAKRMGRNQVWARRDVMTEPPQAGHPEWWEQLQLEAIRSLATAADARDSHAHKHSDEAARLATFSCLSPTLFMP